MYIDIPNDSKCERYLQHTLCGKPLTGKSLDRSASVGDSHSYENHHVGF